MCEWHAGPAGHVGHRRHRPVAPCDAGRRAHRAPCRIDADASERGEVDDEAAITGAEARDVVSAATNRHKQIVVTGESQRVQDVRRTGAPGDDGRPLVDEAVPHAPRLLVPDGVLDHHTSGQATGERIYHRGFESDVIAGQRSCEYHGRLTTAAIVVAVS